MLKTFLRFLKEEEGQDFAEYALILGAVGVVAIAVIV
jgi:Flp pilus assembly pilin Flp